MTFLAGLYEYILSGEEIKVSGKAGASILAPDSAVTWGDEGKW